MIFCVTSSIAIKPLKSFFNQKEFRNRVKFIVFDAFDKTHSTDKIIEPNTIQVNSGQELEILISTNWSNDDLIINFDCFHVFSKQFLKNKIGRCVNFHPSLLPSYGGVNPISWGLYNKETTWGYTWHTVTDEIDNGAIILQKSFQVNERISQFQLMSFCLLEGLKGLPFVIDHFSNISHRHSEHKNSSPSYYSGRNSPTFELNSINDALFYIRVLPFSRNKKWRWTASFEDVKITALSTSEVFGGLRLRKKILLFEQQFFYGTTNL